MPPVSIGERIFYFTAHQSLRLIFKPIKGVCSIIKDMGNDMHASGCGSVLKCWLMGKCRLLLPCLPLQGTGKSTEADPESIDIFYTSHCQKNKRWSSTASTLQKQSTLSFSLVWRPGTDTQMVEMPNQRLDCQQTPSPLALQE